MKLVCIKKPYYFWPFTIGKKYELKYSKNHQHVKTNKKFQKSKYYIIDDNNYELTIPEIKNYSEFLIPLDEFRESRIRSILR